jgi:cobalamin biosynthesis Co2+ chelatase CbiK
MSDVLMQHIKMIDGDEYDALIRRGRRVHRFRAGDRARIKRKFRRRERHQQRVVKNAG